jgi:uncharacterized protein (DUF1684 family)
MDALQKFRQDRDEAFRLDPDSPLDPDQRRAFAGLHYFPPNPALDLALQVEELDPKTEIEMQTTTGDVRRYERFGHVRFEIDGQPVRLTVFRVGSDFFLPFADSLAGKETYGAGRYLEPERLPDGRMHLDFNLAYNPYCAYSPHWSCTVTPVENRITVPIRAGERIFAANR